MEKMKMKTNDLAQENYAKLKAMFPEAVTETVDDEGNLVRGIDADQLRQAISQVVVEGNKERYQMTWPGKREAIHLANQPINKTLRPCREESVDFDTTENLYIEGDNLDVLKLLRETYLGKVKMIYIDPPYNTGSDFIYTDDFKQESFAHLLSSGQTDEEGMRLVVNKETNGRFHSDWLSMIYPRLRLAKDLLRDDGVIFISIDDNEVENLKKICDEIFGCDNFIAQITVVGNPRGRDYGGIARMHDYILVYKKSNANELYLIPDENNEFNMFDSISGFELRELRNRNIRFNKTNRPNLYYPFYVNPHIVDDNGLHPISLDFQQGWVELYPLESQGIKTVWRWGKEKSKNNLNINIMAKPMRNGNYMIVEKYRESKRMARSVWWDKTTNTERGTLLVKELFNKKVFDYPKPVEMLKTILEIGISEDQNNNNIVLDFFSGSATTAHAVMQLNAERMLANADSDGYANSAEVKLGGGGSSGKISGIKFIMVQLPEVCDEKSEAYEDGYKNICEIGKERIRRAGKKIKAENPLFAKELDTGFRVLKTDSSNMENVYYNPDDLSQRDLFNQADNVKADRSHEDLLFQVMLELGIELSSPIEKIQEGDYTFYNVAEKHLLACFDENITEIIVEKIAKYQPAYAVFRDKGFEKDSTAINFDQIFKSHSPDTECRVL